MLSLFRRNRDSVLHRPVEVAKPIDLNPFAILIEGVAAMHQPPASQFDRSENRFGRQGLFD